MKTPCGVIRDLLPLYAENLACGESCDLIREHLDECESCSGYLKSLQSPIGVAAAASSAGSLKMVRNGIRSRKTAAVLLAALLVFTAMLTAFSHIVKPDYISYKDSGITLTEAENGEVYARFSGGATSCKVLKFTDEGNRRVVEIEAWTSLWDKILGKAAPSALVFSSADRADVVYYCDLSSEADNMTVVFGTAAEENSLVLSRLVPGYYFAAALAAAVLLGIACLVFRKNAKLGLACRYLFAAPLSYALGHLIITTGFASFNSTGDFILNCAAALAIYGILLSGAYLLRQRMRDKLPK